MKLRRPKEYRPHIGGSQEGMLFRDRMSQGFQYTLGSFHCIAMRVVGKGLVEPGDILSIARGMSIHNNEEASRQDFLHLKAAVREGTEGEEV